MKLRKKLEFSRTPAIQLLQVKRPGIDIAVSALAWGARGRWFEPSRPDHKNFKSYRFFGRL